MMEAVRTSDTWVLFKKTTRRYIPEGSHLRVIRFSPVNIIPPGLTLGPLVAAVQRRYLTPSGQYYPLGSTGTVSGPTKEWKKNKNKDTKK
jgi:hypothetical protein